MKASLRSIQIAAALLAAVVALAMLIDDDGTWLGAIVFAAVAVSWAVMPEVTDGGKPGRASIFRLSAMASIATCAVLLIILLVA